MKILILHQLVKIWNQLPTSLKRFYTIKKFNTKSKKILTVSRRRQYRLVGSLIILIP